LAFTSRR